MPTNYAGREDEHDLGDGHSYAWMTDETGALIGLIEHHPAAPDVLYCGDYIAWRQPVNDTHTVVRHQLVAGGPG